MIKCISVRVRTFLQDLGILCRYLDCVQFVAVVQVILCVLLQVIYVTSLRVSLVKRLDTHSIIIQLLLVQYTTQAAIVTS